MPLRPFAATLAAALVLFALPTPTQATPPPPFEDCQTQTGRNASVLLKNPLRFYLLHNPGRIGALQEGDMVAAYTPEGVCAGVVVWGGHTTMLPLWEDDPLTETKDGFEPGDDLSLRVWDASSGAVLSSLRVLYQDPFDTSGEYGTRTIFSPFFALFSPLPTSGATPMPYDAGRTAQSVALPEEFTLAANYPNPFQSSTTIRYGLPEAAAVRLDVYDALGRHVTTLIDEEQEAGWHDVELRASSLAAGLYVAQFRAGDFVASRRMTLVR